MSTPQPATSTPFHDSRCHQLPEIATPESSLYLPPTMLEADQTSASGIELESVCRPIEHLNTFLKSRDISPVRYTLKTPWEEASGRTKRQHECKAKQVISAVLDEIAPNDADQLWKAIIVSQNHTGSDGVDDVLMDTLAKCYKNASIWDSPRQKLSIMADKVSLARIRDWIPGLTRFRFMVARQHALVHGSGEPVRTQPKPREVIPEAKLARVLDFITSSHVIQDLPFGGKTITLSNNEIMEVPNVVRNLIPERIVRQYEAYSAESNFTPMSRSTLLRILRVCSASTRKSLQGLDYISLTGAQAFEDLQGIAHRLGEKGMGLTWAKRQEEALKETKRYLKTDYKVRLPS